MESRTGFAHARAILLIMERERRLQAAGEVEDVTIHCGKCGGQFASAAAFKAHGSCVALPVSANGRR
jgi:hypothetical protein